MDIAATVGSTGEDPSNHISNSFELNPTGMQVMDAPGVGRSWRNYFESLCL